MWSIDRKLTGPVIIDCLANLNLILILTLTQNPNPTKPKHLHFTHDLSLLSIQSNPAVTILTA